MWGEFGRAVVNKFRKPAPDERGAATTSCHQAAVPKQEALEELGIRLVDVTEFEQYQDARKRLAEKGITIAGAADSAFLYSICQQLKPESVLETGVAHGMSSLAILLAMNETASGHLTSIDMPYRGSTDDSYVGQAVPESLRSRWSLLKLPDRRGIPRAIALGASFDLVHYDSDKTRSGREFAYPLCLPGICGKSRSQPVNLGQVRRQLLCRGHSKTCLSNLSPKGCSFVRAVFGSTR